VLAGHRGTGRISRQPGGWSIIRTAWYRPSVGQNPRRKSVQPSLPEPPAQTPPVCDHECFHAKSGMGETGLQPILAAMPLQSVHPPVSRCVLDGHLGTVLPCAKDGSDPLDDSLQRATRHESGRVAGDPGQCAICLWGRAHYVVCSHFLHRPAEMREPSMGDLARIWRNARKKRRRW